MIQIIPAAFFIAADHDPDHPRRLPQGAKDDPNHPNRLPPCGKDDPSLAAC
jgi:hypothetical protein